MYRAKHFMQVISDWQCFKNYYGVIRQHTRISDIFWLNVTHSIQQSIACWSWPQLTRPALRCGGLLTHLGGGRRAGAGLLDDDLRGWGRAWRWRLLHDLLYHRLRRRRRAGAGAGRVLDNLNLPHKIALARVPHTFLALVPHSMTCTQK